MSALVLLAVVLAITTVATSLLRRKIAADARRQHEVVITITLDTTRFDASLQQMLVGFREMTRAGYAAQASMRAFNNTVRRTVD